MTRHIIVINHEIGIYKGVILHMRSSTKVSSSVTVDVIDCY
jgi:hypothetical protein